MVGMTVAQDDFIHFFQVDSQRLGIMRHRHRLPGVQQNVSIPRFYQDAQSPFRQQPQVIRRILA